jgi:RNA polymerase subunit RPABC4/transcription elongation factor Spt4
MWQGRCVACSRWVEADNRPATCPECGAPWGGHPVPQARSRRDLPLSWYAQGMGDRRLRGDHDEGTHAWGDRPPQPWPDLCPVCAEREAELRALGLK